MLEGV